MKKIKYIKAGGNFYQAMEPGEELKKRADGKHFNNYQARRIKKLLFGRWLIEYYDYWIEKELRGGWTSESHLKANTRIILYPSGIEEIRYTLIQ